MPKPLNIAIAQLNFTVGAIEHNLDKIRDAINKASHQEADLIIFPELAITGYPPEDLLFRPAFIQHAAHALSELAAMCTSINAIVGAPIKHEGKLMNAAVHLSHGKIQGYYFKHRLPNYGIFDEKRYFNPGHELYTFELHDQIIAVTICEDLWTKTVAKHIATSDADVIVSLNASPFETDKAEHRQEVIKKRASESQLPIVYTNLIGGQDELIFDGGSFVCNGSGEITAQFPAFTEGLFTTQLDHNQIEHSNAKLATIKQIHDALVLGIKDYVEKNDFPGVLIGLSGGIDSAVTLALAAKAIAKEHIHTIMMPSRHTSQMSLDDAKALAGTLAVQYDIIDIEPPYQALLESTKAHIDAWPASTAKENLQARCRGAMLMAVSNASGKLVLTTGNRSEMAVGYATLYGDMAGGLAVLKDLPKTQVYELAHYINRDTIIIPERIITRPPSAELSDNQTDQDSLPPYDILDQIIALHIDDDLDAKAIISQGFEPETVNKVIRLIRLAEYKRRQAPPGIRVRHKAFGKDRRYPITTKC